MAIGKNKWDALKEKMKKLHIEEEDLIEQSILSSGKGGQKVNKVAVAIHLKHLPTKIHIKCQQTRSKELNRYLARKKLCESIEETLDGINSKKNQMRVKIQKQKKRNRRRAKKKQEES